MKEEMTEIQLNWVDSMAFWMDTMGLHLKESAYEGQEHLGGLSIADNISGAFAIRFALASTFLLLPFCVDVNNP